MIADVQTKTGNETGLDIHYLTSGEHANTIAYPTCQTWTPDSKSLFVESSRPRPDGTKFPREFQLLKIDIATGVATHLASMEWEDPSQYGAAHIQHSTRFHFDYAPKANVIVYYDVSGHNLYLLDVATGRSNLLLHEPEGTIGDPPAITHDGKRVVYYVLYPSTPNRYFGSMNSVIFALDVDPVTLKPVGEPKVIVAYPERIIPNMQGPLGVFVNHSQMNPKNPDHYIFSHHIVGIEFDGSPTLSRCWENIDGVSRPVFKHGSDEWYAHEVFGPKGRTLYMADTWRVSASDFGSGVKRVIYANEEELNACHVTVSPDEKWIAADMWNSREADTNGCYPSGIMLIEVVTGKAKVLCRIARADDHPRHPHPNFSPDGTKIAFVTAEGKTCSRVAWMDLSEVIRNWEN